MHPLFPLPHKTGTFHSCICTAQLRLGGGAGEVADREAWATQSLGSVSGRQFCTISRTHEAAAASGYTCVSERVNERP